MELAVADHPDLFPNLPRKSVGRTIRDEWNALRRATNDLGGIISAPDAARVLGVSRNRMYQLLDAGAIRSIKSDHFLYVSAADVEDRLRHPVATGRPARK